MKTTMKTEAVDIPEYVVDRDLYLRAVRMYDASKSGWRHFMVDQMSDHYMIYHWSMPALLFAEAAALVYLAIWPMWFAVPLFAAGWYAFSWFNEQVAYWAWCRYDRIRSKSYTAREQKPAGVSKAVAAFGPVEEDDED